MLTGSDGTRDRNVACRLGRVLGRHHSIDIDRNRGACHDADGGVGRYFTRKWLPRHCLADDDESERVVLARPGRLGAA